MNITPEPERLPPKLIFDVRTAAGTTPDEAASQRWELVTVRGEVDMHTAGQVVDAVEEVAGTAVVDLSAVTFIDSRGIRGLLQAQRALRERGDELILRDPSSSVRRVLELTGMTDVFPVEDDGPARPE